MAEAQEDLDVVMAQLKDAKARLEGVQKRLAELQKGFDDSVAKKQVKTETSERTCDGCISPPSYDNIQLKLKMGVRNKEHDLAVHLRDIQQMSSLAKLCSIAMRLSASSSTFVSIALLLRQQQAIR